MEINAQELMDFVVTQATAWGLRLISAAVLVVVGVFVARRMRAGVRRLMERGEVDPTLVPFLSGLVYYAAVAVVGVAVLGMVGIQTASIIAVLGAAGLAVGLALQGTLSNFAAGVMLLVLRPFRVGNYVEVGGVSGSVHAIGLFSTVLDTPDNVRIVIPNSSVFGSIIKNFGAHDTRRNDMTVGISYDDDIGVALDTIRQVLADDPRVLADPEPIVGVGELGDSSVNIVVRPWCARSDYLELRFALMRQFKEKLEAAGCSIPYPQRDVHLVQSDRVSPSP